MARGLVNSQSRSALSSGLQPPGPPVDRVHRPLRPQPYGQRRSSHFREGVQALVTLYQAQPVALALMGPIVRAEVIEA
jgi:hypothetical protein